MSWKTLSEGLAQVRREKSARERRDIEQAEIAEAVGVTVTTYSRWERGKRTPDENDVGRLAKYFGVTPAYLRYGPQPNETYHVPIDIIEPLDAEEVLRQEAKEKAARARGGHHPRKRAG